jgi:hypothetical protein
LVDDHRSEEAFRIFEFDPSTTVSADDWDRVHPEDLPTFDKVIAQGMTGTDVDSFPHPDHSRRGETWAPARVMGAGCRAPLVHRRCRITESRAAEEDAWNRARSELAESDASDDAEHADRFDRP